MTKKLLFVCIYLITAFGLAQTVTINESGGWLESAFVKWQPVAGADSYNVYFSGEGITGQKIDDQLIRCYPGYLRADILGLKSGSYTISIAPVTSGIEGTSTTTGSITVEAHDRSGFAFSNGRIPGAYKADGTPKDNAVVLYITENSKNTIYLNVTGANANPCVGLQTILDGFKKGNDNRPLIVRLIGQITDLDYMLSGDIVIENKNNISSYITFEGVGDDAVAYGWGIRVKNATNIEIRNIGTMLTDSTEGDNVGLQQNNDYIWVHNMDLFYGEAGGDADQAKGDGALDCKLSTYVTFSYNHFWDSGKSNLLGLGENTTTGLYITYHHNWYDHSDSRHPRVRFYSAHVYNNYYDGVAKYGVGSTEGSSVFVENNYFRNCKYPMLTSMQGTDIFYGSPTFSSEDGGTIKAFGNDISGATRFVPYGDGGFPNSTVQFDAYVASTRNETVPSMVTSVQGANTYNNFDTNPSIIYAYTPDTALDAKNKVMLYAGRMNGGDFNWTFNNAVDDTSSAVNVPLKNALSSYMTSLLCVQGETGPDPEITLTATAGDATVNLSWSLTNYTPSAFEVFRDTDSNPIGRIKIADIADPNAVSYIDNTVTNNTTYYYWVVADGAVESNVDSATPTEGGTTPGDEIHNFTLFGTSSTFFIISGNLSTSKGDAHYDGLTLTQCLKMESSTSITFTTISPSTLTLVLNDGYTGSLNVNGAPYNGVNGIITIELAAGNHIIQRTSGVTSTNLYYMSVTYNSLGINNIEKPSIRLFPNPVSDHLNINSTGSINTVEIYDMLGKLVKSIESPSESIDLSNLSKGSYLVKLFIDQNIINKFIIKK